MNRYKYILIIIILLLPLQLNALGRISASIPEMGEIVKVYDIGEGSFEVKVRTDIKGNVPYGLFNGPMSFKVKKGVFYLLDSLNRRIHITKNDKSMVIEYDKNILASDFTILKTSFALTSVKTAKIHIIDIKGKTLSSFGESGNEDGQFIQMDFIGHDTLENILVLDYGNKGRISRFSKDHKFSGYERKGASLFSDNDNIRYVTEFHRDTGFFVVYKCGMDGTLRDPLYKFPQDGRGSIDVIGADLDNNIYIKVFNPPLMSIYKISPQGKLIKTFEAHNDPGMDFNRYFTLDEITGEVYSIFYREKKIHISRLK